MEGKTKYKRSANYTNEEKRLLLQYVEEHGAIMENKATDVEVYKKKRAGWIEASNILKAHGYNREPKIIKELYYRLKADAKRSICKYNAAVAKADGGKVECKSPTPFDWQIYKICPRDFQRTTNPNPHDIDNNTNRLSSSPLPSSNGDSSSAFSFSLKEIKEQPWRPILPHIEKVILPDMSNDERIDNRSIVEEVNQPEYQQETAFLQDLLHVKLETESPGIQENPVEADPPQEPSPPPGGSLKRSKKKQISPYELEVLQLYEVEAENKQELRKQIHLKEMELLKCKIKREKEEAELSKSKFEVERIILELQQEKIILENEKLKLENEKLRTELNKL